MFIKKKKRRFSINCSCFNRSCLLAHKWLKCIVWECLLLRGNAVDSGKTSIFWAIFKPSLPHVWACMAPPAVLGPLWLIREVTAKTSFRTLSPCHFLFPPRSFLFLCCRHTVSPGCAPKAACHSRELDYYNYWMRLWFSSQVLREERQVKTSIVQAWSVSRSWSSLIF